jgi:predicted HAD superfamily Cof-like phosphohydrolase
MTKRGHFFDKGDGRFFFNPMFTFIADPSAIFDADREALLVKIVKDGEAGLDYSHGQTGNKAKWKKKAALDEGAASI